MLYVHESSKYTVYELTSHTFPDYLIRSAITFDIGHFTQCIRDFLYDKCDRYCIFVYALLCA